MRHQSHPGALAGPRTEDGGASGSGAPSAPSAPRVDDPFVAGLQTIARRLLFSTPRLASTDRQFLYDVARQEARFPMTGLRRLMAIAAHSTKPEDREALPELIRAECLVGVHAVDVAIAFDEETAAQGIADVAQRAYERHPSPTTQARVVEAFTAHLTGLRRSLDAVLSSGRTVGRTLARHR